MNVIPGPSATPPASQTTVVDRSALWRRTALASAAAALLAVGALTATLWQRQAPVAEPAPRAEAVATPAPTPPVAVATDPSPAAATTAAAEPTPAPVVTAQARSDAAETTAPVEARSDAEPAPPPPRPVAKPKAKHAAARVCADCGTVESVTAVTHEGQGTGIGAVAGGVLGGVLGHQIGGGNGRKALTVLGAIGGGLAGNQIEKHRRATTDYEVTVRMDDGSRRTITQAQAPSVGQPVRVDGSQLLPAAAPHRAAPREGDR